MKHIYLISIVFVLVLVGITAKGQAVGGNRTPLLNSVHTYSITMGDASFTPNWGLYPSGTTASQIEEGTATPLTPGVHYTIITLPVAEQIVGGVSFWRIQFNLTITEYETYIIGYKETTADANECLTAVVQEITVQSSFDVDVELANAAIDATRCGDETNMLQQPGFTTLQTAITYRVFIDYPENLPGYVSGGTGNWRFDFNISAVGRGSLPNKDASIAGIEAHDGGGTIVDSWTPAANTSDYTADLQVTPSSTHEVFITVTYNEVLGVTQDITFQLSAIRGAFYEPDIDETNNRPDLNRVSNVLYGMPNVGDILVLN